LSTQIRIVKQVKYDDILFEELEQTNLSFGSDIKKFMLSQPPMLEDGNILVEKGNCSIKMSLWEGKVKLHFNDYLFERVNIYIAYEPLLFLGVLVQRKDTRFTSKGIVLKIIEDRKLAQVDWGNSSCRWHAFRELHTLDGLGNPVLENTNIFQSAIRGRISILAKSVVTKSAQSEFSLENISQTKKEVIFQVGDMVKYADIYHIRGSDTGIIESCTKDGEYIVWWESDDDNQIAKSFRTFGADKLTLISIRRIRKFRS
jgi:hypothetical protein